MIKIVVVFLIIGIFLIYLAGVSKVVFGGDSADIILSYYFGGVAHPPGYPLNTILGFILTKFMPGEFAYRANMVSAVYQAISIGLLFFLAHKLTKNWKISLFGSLTLAFIPLFWLYAHVAEVFQLNILLVLASLIFLFEYWNLGKKKKRRLLFFSVFFWSLAVFHHQTSLLLAPAFIFALRKFRKFLSFGDFFKMIAVFLSGALPYLFVFWAAFRKTPINWDDPSNLSGFWQLVTRSDYGTFTASTDLVGFSIQARLVQVYWYCKVIWADFTPVGVLFIFAGLAWLFKKRREWFWFFSLAAFFSGPFFLAYASFPPVEALLLGISERFLLLNYVFLAILLIFGMFFWVNLFVGLFSKFAGRRKLVELTCGLALFLLPLNLYIINLPKTDLSDFKLGEVLAHDVLLAAYPAGIIFLQGDTLTFNTQYSFYVDRINNQSSIIMTGRLKHASYRRQLIREYPKLNFPEKFSSSSNLEYSDTVIELINSNFADFAIYSFSPINVTESYVWLQQGMLNRLYKKDDLPKNVEITSKVVEKLEKLTFSADLLHGRYLNFFDENIKNIYTGVYVANAFELLRRGSIDDAKSYFDLAVSLSPGHKSALFGLGVSYFEKKDCTSSAAVFKSIVDVDSTYWQAWEGLGQVYKSCFADEFLAKQYFERAESERKKLFDKPTNEI